MEDETLPTVVFQRLQIADIQQLCAVKSCITSLSQRGQHNKSPTFVQPEVQCKLFAPF